MTFFFISRLMLTCHHLSEAFSDHFINTSTPSPIPAWPCLSSHFMFLGSIYCHLTCHMGDFLVLFIICPPPTRMQAPLSVLFTALSLCLDYDGTQEVLNKYPLSEHILLFPSWSSAALSSLEPGQFLPGPGKTIQNYTAHSSCSIRVHRIKPNCPPQKNIVSKPSSKILPKKL